MRFDARPELDIEGSDFRACEKFRGSDEASNAEKRLLYGFETSSGCGKERRLSR